MPTPLCALVSGVTGFIGASLASRLIAEGVQVYGLVRAGSRNVSRIAHLPGLKPVEVSTFSREELRSSLRDVRPDFVFHLAAAGVQQGDRDPNDLLAGNVDLLVNLMQAIANTPVTRFIHAGSCFEYGPCEPGRLIRESDCLQPLSLYGAAKQSAWLCGRVLARQMSIPFLTLRLFGCFGSGEAPQRLLPYVVGKLAAGETVELTHGQQARDFLHIEDVTDAIWTAARMPVPAAEVFNVCSGEATTIRTLVGSVAEILGRPPALLLWGARPSRTDEPAWIVGDPGAFRRASGWGPRLSLREGLRRTVSEILGTRAFALGA